MANRNVNLTVIKTEYDKDRKHATVYGQSDHVKHEIDGKQMDRISGGLADITQYNAINKALKSVLYKASTNYYTADVTINDATLPDSLQAFIKDKYEVETQINSITFT